ncbi:inositol phospholipid synthesis and fat-storage-inducing TM-domain-containing protein [Aspergillus spectabilis]
MPPASTSSTSTSTPPTITPTLSRFSPPSALLLLIYPITLIAGSLFSVLSPTAHSSNPTEPINYFARKDNIFNLYFVKIGWIWFTFAFASLLVASPPSSSRGRRQLQSLTRYTLTSVVWYATTQWFFGPAIIDRSFVLTGGKCEAVLRGLSESQSVQEKGVVGAAVSGEESLGVYLTAAACKAAGGSWRGGHDVSGHVFMLVLVTAALGFEAVGVIQAQHQTENVDGNGKKVEGGSAPSESESDSGDEVRTWALRFVGVVVGLGYWMLLMTAIWFHTWLEKANGLIISLAAVYTIYVLPRRVIPWRDIVGLPGL